MNLLHQEEANLHLLRSQLLQLHRPRRKRRLLLLQHLSRQLHHHLLLQPRRSPNRRRLHRLRLSRTLTPLRPIMLQSRRLRRMRSQNPTIPIAAVDLSIPAMVVATWRFPSLTMSLGVAIPARGTKTILLRWAGFVPNLSTADRKGLRHAPRPPGVCVSSSGTADSELHLLEYER